MNNKRMFRVRIHFKKILVAIIIVGLLLIPVIIIATSNKEMGEGFGFLGVEGSEVYLKTN